jgi:diguanylate cyclase (GGDEF)-like protein
MSTVTQPTAVAIIADDEDLGRLLLAESVAEVGLQPLVFADGLPALDAALNSNPMIVLLDVDMPGMNGYEVCRRLRAEPRYVNVPIVMVTGHEDAVAIALAFEAGATDFISKPVNWALLPRRLDYILRNAAAARELNARMVEVHTLVEALPDTLWVVAPAGHVRWSPNADVDIDQLAPPALAGQVDAAIRQTVADGICRTIEYRTESTPGIISSYELRLNRRVGGDVVVVRRNTTERTAAAAHIERLAYFDPLTGLANRQQCMETAERMFAQAQRDNEGVAVICLDLYSLKRVNDTFGHAMGDAVLKAFATRLTATVASFATKPERLLISRFGSDEFVIVLRQPQARDGALQIAQACVQAFNLPITHDSLEFFAAPGIGFAVYPDDGADVATVLKFADTAMYQAKAKGTVAAYTPAMSTRMRDWLELEGRLRRAVHEEMLALVFQPKYRLQDNKIMGVEALLRWHDADHGEISPSRFIEIAEEGGLILDLGRWVVRAACRQLRNWLDMGLNIPIAINCSGKELVHADVARLVESAAAEAGVPTTMIEIEITESVLIKDSAAVQSTLSRLRQLGCRIALDDFGTAYSSLSYITRFPPDRIKIDKSFIRNVDQSRGDAAVAKAILALASSMNLLVTAEGVERREQLDWLRERGCNEAQGFLLCRPLSAVDLESRLVADMRHQDEASVRTVRR